MLRFVLLGCTGNSAQQSEPAHLITCDPFLEMSTSILLEFFFFVLVGWGFFGGVFCFPVLGAGVHILHITPFIITFSYH